MTPELPGVPGHEGVGVVEAVGPKVSSSCRLFAVRRHRVWRCVVEVEANVPVRATH